jgi:hypothetical protein
MVINPEDVVVDDASPAAEELEPDDVVPPTSPLTATTSPLMGAVRVAEPMAASASIAASVAVSTLSSAELICDLAEVTACVACDVSVELELEPLDPLDPPAADSVLAVAALAAFAVAVASSLFAVVRAEFASASSVLASARVLYASVCASTRSSVRRVPMTSPAVTVEPSATFTVAMVPETANDALTSRAAAMDPLAVMVLLTAPCCTVPVSCVASTLLAALTGLMTKKAPVPAARITTARVVLTTRGRESFIPVGFLNFLSGFSAESEKVLWMRTAWLNCPQK